MGYLLNVTHVIPILTLEKELFKEELHSYHFSSGGYLLNSLLTENIDFAFIGPGPYINAIDKGVKLKLLGSYAYGANSLILSSKYRDAKKSELKNLRMAVPQFGNTQDLLSKMFFDDIIKEYIAIAPAELEFAFFTDSIDLALVSEPWGTILVKNGLVNAKNIFPKRLEKLNEFPSTLLVVNEASYVKNQNFYRKFKDNIDELYTEIQSGTDYNEILEKHFFEISKKNLEDGLMASSLKSIKFKNDNKLEEYLDELKKAAIKANYL